MKKFFLLLLFLNSVTNVNAQQKIHFDYDIAGNQTNRIWCTSCLSKTSKEDIKELADLKSEDLQKFLPEDNFSYYPNPVKEELYLKWKPIDGYNISSISIFSVQGQLIRIYKDLNKIDTQTINFYDYPEGIYVLSLNYTNGEQKTIKIIKK